MNCELKFLRNENGIFHAGSNLEATVELFLTESMTINGENLKINQMIYNTI